MTDAGEGAGEGAAPAKTAIGARHLPVAAGQAGPDEPDGHYGQLGIVTFSHAVQHFYPAGLAVSYPFVIAALHVSYGTLGLVLGIAGIVGGLLQALAGAFSRVSARMLLSLQNIGLAAATGLGALAPGFAVFGAARCLGSIASWPQHPVGSSVLTERFPRRRAFALSWHVAGGSLGTAVIPIVVSALIASYGWRWGVGFVAFPLAIGGLLVAWRLRDPPRRKGDPEPASFSGLLGLLRRREVLGAVVAGTLAAGGRGLGTLTTFVPAYLRSGLHLEALTIGVLFTVLLVGSIVGPVLVGLVADHLGRRRVLIVIYLVSSVTIGGFVSVGHGLVALGLMGALVGIFAYSESPLLQAVFSEAVHGSAQKGAFGLYFAISYGVGSIWTIALGVIIDTAGFRVAFFVMAASFVLAAVVVALSGPPRTGAVKEPGSARP